LSFFLICKTSMTTTFEVKLGKYSINNGFLAEHWAAKIGDTWYELLGASKKQDGIRNEINAHKDDSRYTTITRIGSYCCKGDVGEFITRWSNKWIATHPIYRINGDNCQKYVAHMLKDLFDYDVATQNRDLGNRIIGAGVGAIIVGAFALLGGLLLRGNH